MAVRFKSVAERVAHRMKALGLNQSALARRSGYKQQGIQSILAGKSENPRNILDLATALETTPEWLLREKGPEVDPNLATRRIVMDELQTTDDLGIFPEIARLLELRRGKAV